ncbi:glycosyltransferase family 2 protein [Candidatus Venteria ishoeyi]|uniref:Abequosyltransferase RfbV n=1 Tax=Candidatus Venteria ishoeyi TaxID=1899563 RepID=A0A1H6FC32_9GAMM|nr:glycosyltransferase family 2 protein [Candidatus Venteria ishoeyi]SEH06706.1 Abequosyltransferase RfbV [Candidatus Venteria ishoeyi]
MNKIPAAKILIIVVTWNKKKYVLELLEAINHLDYPSEHIDIVVVDNASADGTVEAIRKQHPDVVLLCNQENLGGTGGFNTGLQYAFKQPEGQYDYLWLLDNDVLVHRSALNALVDILDTRQDIAVAGSTMMQLDYPWRINEMGAFVNAENGSLMLNRHFEEIQYWRGRSPQSLIRDKYLDLSQTLANCQPYMDVEYVAAASLLIRADVAKQAGLWQDFFIHFDDVDWCLRIGRMGHRVVVSAQSLIWHLSAAAKVPTWILYYDNRNVLVMLKSMGASPQVLHNVLRYTLKKAVYYALLGKTDLSHLHKDAVDDFLHNRLGKKEIKLKAIPQPNQQIADVFMDKKIKRILFSIVNLQATNIQAILVQAMKQRPEMEVQFIVDPFSQTLNYQIPNARFTNLPGGRFKRYYRYWTLRKHYDLVVQSDYLSIIPLSWLAPQVLFINDETFTLRPRSTIRAVWLTLKSYISAYFLRLKA